MKLNWRRRQEPLLTQIEKLSQGTSTQQNQTGIFLKFFAHFATGLAGLPG
jgi:hypothetical protein